MNRNEESRTPSNSSPKPPSEKKKIARERRTWLIRHRGALVSLAKSASGGTHADQGGCPTFPNAAFPNAAFPNAASPHATLRNSGEARLKSRPVASPRQEPGHEGRECRCS